MIDELNPDNDGEEKPPVLKSWNKLYLFVIAQTALLILIFYLFTRFFE